MSKAEGAISLHRDWFIDFARIFLGLILILKGIYFLNGMESLMSLSGGEFANNTDFGLAYGTLAHFIIFVHILGGVAVVVGLLTRAVIPVQFPVLIIAMLSGPIAKVYMPGGSPTEILMLIFLLTGIMIYGSGRFSLDYYLRGKRDKTVE